MSIASITSGNGAFSFYSSVMHNTSFWRPFGIGRVLGSLIGIEL